MPSRTLLVVPCYNEAVRLPRAAFRDHLNEQPPIDLLFVDDGSTDGTRRVLEELVTSAPARLSVLGLAANQGKGEAIRQGVLSAFDRGYEFIGYWDADLATPLEAVQAFIPVLDRQPTLQCVFGARVKLMGRSITRRSIRHYAGRLFAAATSLTLGLGIYDTQCGAKIFRVTPAVRQAFSTPFISRWIFDVELFSRLTRQAGTRSDEAASAILYELPLLTWTDVAGSTLRGRDFIRAAWELAQIWFTRRGE